MPSVNTTPLGGTDRLRRPENRRRQDSPSQLPSTSSDHHRGFGLRVFGNTPRTLFKGDVALFIKLVSND
jgi:hypothetical protein